MIQKDGLDCGNIISDFTLSHVIPDFALSHVIPDFALSHVIPDFTLSHVIPDFALSHVIPDLIGNPVCFVWIPAFAGMTSIRMEFFS